MIFKYPFYFVDIELTFGPFLFVNLLFDDGKNVNNNYFILNINN